MKGYVTAAFEAKHRQRMFVYLHLSCQTVFSLASGHYDDYFLFFFYQFGAKTATDDVWHA